MGIFNLKKRESSEETVDFEKHLTSIMEFLANVGHDVKDLYHLGIKVKKLRHKERSEVDSKKQKKLLTEEIEAWDKFLERFVMLDRDTDITGERVKKISNVLKEEAVKMSIDTETLKKTRKKDEWVFDW